MTQSASTSALRKQLLGLSERIEALQQLFLERGPLLPGKVYLLRRRCGKPNCRCQQGQLHETEVLGYRGSGRAQTITPAAGELERLRTWTESYRRFRQARAELVRLQARLLELIDAIGEARVEQGRRRFEAMQSGRRAKRA